MQDLEWHVPDWLLTRRDRLMIGRARTPQIVCFGRDPRGGQRTHFASQLFEEMQRRDYVVSLFHTRFQSMQHYIFVWTFLLSSHGIHLTENGNPTTTKEYTVLYAPALSAYTYLWQCLERRMLCQRQHI